MKLAKTAFLSAFLLGSFCSMPALAVDKADIQAPQIQAAQSDNQSAASAVAGNKVNINTATAGEIQSALVGIGAKKAEAVVQYRDKHGPFTSVEQLTEVQGIGKATLEKNRDRIML
ncbi:helix-hairpin-helix domain-containing protein [Pasteurellaceae bacterium LIM206]|nr:helix-hairpin-helix domain-containing protein [Pasteurellaceae bacterium LIM206]